MENLIFVVVVIAAITAMKKRLTRVHKRSPKKAVAIAAAAPETKKSSTDIPKNTGFPQDLFEKPRSPEEEILWQIERKTKADAAFMEAENLMELGAPIEEVINAYRNVFAIMTDHAQTRYKLGLMYYGVGRYYSAKTELEEAARLDPSSKDEALLRDLEGITKELDALAPKYFKPKESIFAYGVDSRDLEGGKVIDDFTAGPFRAIAVKITRRDEDDPLQYYFKLFLYRDGNRLPSYLIGLERAMSDDCGIGMSVLDGKVAYFAFDLAHKDMCYEEFKYKALGLINHLLLAKVSHKSIA